MKPRIGLLKVDFNRARYHASRRSTLVGNHIYFEVFERALYRVQTFYNLRAYVPTKPSPHRTGSRMIPSLRIQT